jgi:hypothetical protein
MTDGWLMDADCIHGNRWDDCDECWTAGEEQPGEFEEPLPETT